MSRLPARPEGFNTQRPPEVLFLFGLAGAGKNFVGDLLAACSGRFVYHADSDITQEMRDAIAQRRAFSDQMRDDFFHVILARISQLQAQHGPLIVTQAAYKQRHRDFISGSLPGVQFVHIAADDGVILDRLTKRGDWISAEYAKLMRSNFELPSADCPVLLNNGTDADIVAQVTELYPSWI